ncbi:hypothetical protein F4677DRAFT_413314, partial [Hypoxylon crocopeplum]
MPQLTRVPRLPSPPVSHGLLAIVIDLGMAKSISYVVENEIASHRTSAQPGPSLAQQLKEIVSTSATAGIVLDALMRKLSKTLMIALEDIYVSAPTPVYGVDSLEISSLQLLGYNIAEKSALVSENTLKGD